MNPLQIARTLREDYLTLLRTTFAPRQQDLREAFNTEIEREGFLTREPFVSLAQPYRHGPALSMLLEETVHRFGPIAAHPFMHQAQAVQRIMSGQPVVIATGTGSGKTEAFLMPIVDHCLRHPGEPGVKAILIYPMNALAADQLKRIRNLLAGSGVSFGQYTGMTESRGQRSPDAPIELRETRAEFRASPPDILLTNYQMLEFMLIRGDGRDIFRSHQVRFIVLDEVHTYHGALGTDVACLLRRLRASLAETSTVQSPPLFIGTSATLQSPDGGEDPAAGVARFFNRLTGQEVSVDAVISEQIDPPAVRAEIALPPPPDITEQHLAGLDTTDCASVLAIVRRLAGLPTNDSRPLEEVWSGMRLPYLLLSWLRRPLPIRGIIALLALEPERQGVPEDALRREIEAALLVGPCLEDSHPLRLRPRVHRFLRGLARFWRCVNPDCGHLMHEGIESCAVCGSRTLPLAICRTCGWDFFVGREVDGRAIPWDKRVSTAQTVYYYDPPAPDVRTDTEESPFEGGEETGSEETRPAAETQEETEEAQDADSRICPGCLSISGTNAGRTCVCGNEIPQRPVRVHRGRGTRCPICRSRYGRFDVITPVSLGNSSALTHVSRTLLRELPEENRKLLVFCDSRQDAAHQARFIEGVEVHLQLRRAIYRLLEESGQAHDLHWLVEHTYHAFVEEGLLPQTRSRDARQRAMDRIEGGLLSEFVLAANVRAGLERLGLVSVRYSGLEAELDGDEFREFCQRLALNADAARLAVVRLLDFIRSRFAINHEAFRNRLVRGDRLSERYALIPGHQVGLPVAFAQPGQRSENRPTYKIFSTWNESGAPAGTQSLWRRILGDQATMESMRGILEWLGNPRAGWLTRSRIGRRADEAEGYQLDWEAIEISRGASFSRCNVCGRAAADTAPGMPCPRPGCEGRFVAWRGPLEDNNLNATLIAADYTPPLKPAEHSAAVSADRREEIEVGFQRNPPVYNVLVCTPTLELGVNIGDLEAVTMRNVPPSPANYAQRAGRTGRQSRMGMVVGFARNTPHDGYFFDHPDEVIVGAIPPPRFNLANLQAAARHIRSLVLEEARLDFPSNLETYIVEDGALNAVNVQALIRQISAGLDRAAQRAREVFGEQLSFLRQDWENWLGEIVRGASQLVQSALETRASLIEDAVRRMRGLGNQVRQTQRQRDAEEGYRNLARKLREDFRYAYLPRVLAEMGILPGYAFPGDPGSLSLGYDPDPVFSGRLQAQREFAPGQIVYARGHRWRVQGLAMNRPGAPSHARGADRFEFTECPSCGLANPASGANTCTRCNVDLGGGNTSAWDAGAFQAWPADVEPETEEERQQTPFDVRAHPQRDVESRNFTLGPWILELRLQEEIWWINHGLLRQALPNQEARAVGFNLCPVCGELRPDIQAAEQSQGRRRRQNRDPRASRDPHDERCGGVATAIALGHRNRADTLRLFVPGLAGLWDEGLQWAWSMAWAVVQGAVRYFDLDEDDIEPMVLARKREGHSEVMEIIWIDTVLGGSGILNEMVLNFPAVAQAAVQHLNGHDCPSSCYRCLRSYRNQRIYRLLNWRLVLPTLMAASSETLTAVGTNRPSQSIMEGPEWDAARREGCGSPLELRLLLAIRQAGLAEPQKQFRITDESGHMLTQADFAYPDRRLLIYVDGLAFHSSIRMRIHDARQTNQLQNMGYRVLRFIGAQIMSSANECILQIRTALDGT